MLTARGDPMDRVVGLEIGAEKLGPKPFEPRELLARIRVVLRRARCGAGRPMSCASGCLRSTAGARQVRVNGEEKAAYQLSVRSPGGNGGAGRAACSRASSLRTSRGASDQPYDPSLDRSVDVHIARIRAAIEEDAKHPRHIITVRGAGYVFAKGTG